jgi:hypothetical protein
MTYRLFLFSVVILLSACGRPCTAAHLRRCQQSAPPECISSTVSGTSIDGHCTCQHTFNDEYLRWYGADILSVEVQ